MIKYTAIYAPLPIKGSRLHQEPSVIKFVCGQDETIIEALNREGIEEGRVSFLMNGWAQEVGKKSLPSSNKDTVKARNEDLEFLLSILRDHARVGDLIFALKEWSRVAGMPEDVVNKARALFRCEFLN